jgi:hypothetical protein
MKKKAVLFSLLFSLLVLFSLESCIRTSNNCPETYYKLKEITFLSLVNKNGAKYHDYYNYDYMGIDSVAATDTLGMKLAFMAEFYAENTSKWQPNFSFFPTAQAELIFCSNDGEKGRKEKITNIEITSNSDFDAEHLANQPLNDLLFMIDNESGNFSVPFNDFVESLKAEDKRVGWRASTAGPGFLLLLKKKPVLSRNHTFTVWVKYSDKREYRINSYQVLFL